VNALRILLVLKTRAPKLHSRRIPWPTRGLALPPFSLPLHTQLIEVNACLLRPCCTLLLKVGGAFARIYVRWFMVHTWDPLFLKNLLQRDNRDSVLMLLSVAICRLLSHGSHLLYLYPILSLFSIFHSSFYSQPAYTCIQPHCLHNKFPFKIFCIFLSSWGIFCKLKTHYAKHTDTTS
jgi:hypothetical protein